MIYIVSFALDELAGSIANMDWQLFMDAAPPRVALFCSKTAHCVYDLLVSHAMGELPCEIPVVISNHEDLRDVAEHFGVRFENVPIDPANKQAGQAAHEALLAEHAISVVVLARYMQVVGPGFCQR